MHCKKGKDCSSNKHSLLTKKIVKMPYFGNEKRNRQNSIGKLFSQVVGGFLNAFIKFIK